MSQDGERWWRAVRGLFSIGLVTVGLAVPVAAILDSGNRTFGESLAILGHWYAPLADTFWAVAAVVAAVHVALAVATDFGRRSRELEDRIRMPILVASGVGILLTTTSAGALILATVADVRRLPAAVVGVLGAWMLLLVTDMIWGRTTLAERSHDATKAWEDARRRAAAMGVSDLTDVAPRARRGAEILFWLIPLGTWLGVGLTVVSIQGGPPAPPATYAVVVLLCYPHILMLLAWRSGANVSDSGGVARALRAVLIPVAVLFVALFSVTLATHAHVALSVVYFVFSCVVAGFAATRERARTIPVMRVIQRGATANALCKLRSRHHELASELEREQQERAQLRKQATWHGSLRLRLQRIRRSV